jgi:hypothetical protein
MHLFGMTAGERVFVAWFIGLAVGLTPESLNLGCDYAQLPGNATGNLQPCDMDPGSSPAVTGTEGPRIRPALFPLSQPMRRH